MQSEDFDKKIRDAAEHHHPAYNEGAWTKMEQQLDKHLPQEKNDRRRLIFLLFFFLLLGGGVWYFLEKQGSEQTASTTKVTSSPTIEEEKNGSNNPVSNVGTGTTSVGTSEVPTTVNSSPLVPGDQAASNGTKKKADESLTNAASRLESKEADQLFISTDPAAKRSKKQNEKLLSPGENSLLEKETTTIITSSAPSKTGSDKPGITGDQNKEEKSSNPQPKTSDAPLPTQPGKTSQTEELTTKNKETVESPSTEKKTETKDRKKESAKKRNSLEFTLSAGPDISGAGFDNLGKVRPLYGLGLSYTIRDRFSVRTGFYATDKVYTASPSEYKPGYPIPNFNYLDKIDADCKVFEIPLTIAYKFGISKKQNWFAAGGLSSFIMKKETYDYLYKYPNGSTYTYTRKVDNENKHLFSVISLSAGYTRNLGSRFSLSAEPYIKLPTNGIGAGNIKLQSGGVLFTLGTRLTGKQ